MSEFVIVADSTCDLTQSSLEEHEIEVVPLKVVFGDEVLTDGTECRADTLFDRVQSGGTLPKTSAASPAEFSKCFSRIIRSGKKVLYIGLSSELSSTFQNAVIAAQEFSEGEIEWVDSRNLSTGIGLLIMKAADLRQEGQSLKETADRIRSMTGQVKTGFIIDTLEYLYKGGRLSGLQHLFGSMLKIKPLVRVEDGKMTVAEKLRGSSRKTVDVMLEQALADKVKLDPRRVFVTHAAAENMAQYLKNRLEQELDVEEVLITEAGSVISSHCGPGTVGILYLLK